MVNKNSYFASTGYPQAIERTKYEFIEGSTFLLVCFSAEDQINLKLQTLD